MMTTFKSKLRSIGLIIRSLLLTAYISASGHTAAQSDAKLNPAGDLIPSAEERGALSPDNLNALSRIRGRTELFKNVRVARALNFNALHGKSITFVTLDGVDIKYSGDLTVNSDKSRTWIGLSEKGDHLVVAFGEDGLYGDVSVRGKSYVIMSLPGNRFYVLAEVTPLPIQDHEPPLPPAGSASPPVGAEKLLGK